MRSLPRTNEDIFDTDVLFTPDEFPRAWDMTMEELENSVGDGVDTALVLDVLGSGRIVSADFTVNAPELPPSPALAVVLQAGAVYYIQGKRVLLEDDVILTGITANKPAGVDVHIALDEDDVIVIHQQNDASTNRLALQMAGFPCIGRVTTDADEVTAIDATAESVLAWYPLLTGLLKRVTDLENAGGGGGGGPAYWGALLEAAGVPTTIRQAIVGYIAAHVEEYHSDTGGAGAAPVEQRDEVTVNLLRDRYVLLTMLDNVDDVMPVYRGFVVSAGRGHTVDGDPLDLLDRDASTVAIDEVAHTFG